MSSGKKKKPQKKHAMITAKLQYEHPEVHTQMSSRTDGTVDTGVG